MPRPALARMAIALLGGLVLAACGPAPTQREQWSVFGTAAELQLPSDTAPAMRVEAARFLSQHWHEREREWHPWQDSPLTAFNAALARDGAAQAPPSLRPLIERARALVDESNGAFDPGVGRLIALWGFHTDDYPITSPPPDEATLSTWALRPDSLRDLHCDLAWTCRSNAPGLHLDFNAMAEGLALEEGASGLRERGIRDALLNLGGDVLALGQAAPGKAWRVGLDDGVGGVLGGVDLADGEAFMVSGSYAKFRESADGQRWPHVLDPWSGRPTRHARLSAVLHADAVRADAAATALLSGGPARFEALARGMGLGCALLVDDEGRVWMTSGMAERFRWQQRLPEAARIDTGTGCRGHPRNR